MRSIRAFFIGAGTALLLDRVLGRRRRGAAIPARVDDATIEQRIRSEAFRAAGVSARDVEVEVEDGVATLRGSVEGSESADTLVRRAAKMPGVRDVAAIIRVWERRAA